MRRGREKASRSSLMQMPLYVKSVNGKTLYSQSGPVPTKEREERDKEYG